MVHTGYVSLICTWLYISLTSLIMVISESVRCVVVLVIGDSNYLSSHETNQYWRLAICSWFVWPFYPTISWEMVLTTLHHSSGSRLWQVDAGQTMCGRSFDVPPPAWDPVERPRLMFATGWYNWKNSQTSRENAAEFTIPCHTTSNTMPYHGV